MDERDVQRNRDASERVDRFTSEGYKAAVDQAFEAQKSGMRLSRRFFENWVETLDDQAELNRRTLVGFSSWRRNSRKSSENCRGNRSTPTMAFWIPWTPIRKTSRTWKSGMIEQEIFGVA